MPVETRSSASRSLSRSNRSGWFGLAISIAVVLAIPILVSQIVPFNAGFSTAPDSQPNVVFIGNSMLGTRIDVDEYEALLDDTGAIALVDVGMFSANWYLRLKNSVLVTDQKPDVVFVFFRDDVLTIPLKSTTGNSRAILAKHMTADEHVFEAVIVGNQTLLQKQFLNVRNVYSIQDHHLKARGLVNRTAGSIWFPKLVTATAGRALNVLGILDVDQDEYYSELDEYNDFLQSNNEIFSRQNFRTVEDEIDPIDQLPVRPFEQVVETSFLPPMLELIEGIDTDLVFVRIQPRSVARGVTTSRDGLETYLKSLQMYLESRGAGFIDMSSEPGVTLEMYSTGDHIGPDSMAAYTEIFAQRTSGFYNR